MYLCQYSKRKHFTVKTGALAQLCMGYRKGGEVGEVDDTVGITHLKWGHSTTL